MSPKWQSGRPLPRWHRASALTVAVGVGAAVSFGRLLLATSCGGFCDALAPLRAPAACRRCSGASPTAAATPTAAAAVGRHAFGDRGLAYFDVYEKGQFLELLNRARDSGEERSMGDEEKIQRQISFLELQPLVERPAESPRLVGTWQLAFGGVGRALQIEPAKALLKDKAYAGARVESVTLEILDAVSSRTTISLAKPDGNVEIIAQESAFKTNSKADILDEAAGFRRYLKLKYLDEDLLVLQGRGPAEVYQRV
eukprot:CAMPEP_0183403482 /NCGR_PEP_ID=MMETSP0370-20130417/14606_1 /TAXON_ID=268820 /ORGANISM="Peridinium aciculiferum, Strain PAER-2" /LENGTH=254 /DNA_ID=CAMNT_0025585239 /DNA_START=41 /DNA_END=805 /DNA_ORIENTATION=-